MVFVLLIAPAMIGMLLRPAHPYVTAGSVIVVAAMGISYAFDLPTGYAIVFAGAAAALTAALIADRKTPHGH